MSVVPLGGNMVTVDREGAAVALLPLWDAARAGREADGAGVNLLAALLLGFGIGYCIGRRFMDYNARAEFLEGELEVYKWELDQYRSPTYRSERS